MNFGVIGSAHSHIFSIINDIIRLGGQLKGVFNDKTDNVSKIVEKYNAPIYDDINELFKQKIEIACTSAVNNMKLEVIQACYENNVHVMADKPIVVDKEQYGQIEKIISSGKIQVGLNLSLRFDPTVYTLKKLIDDGAIGQLLSVEIFSPHKLSPESRPEWHFNKNQCGGITVDLIVHSIDAFNWITGSKIVEYSGIVTKSILKEKPDFYDISRFMVLGSTGISGYFRTDWHIPDKYWSWGDIRIFCTGSNGLVEARVVGDPITKEKGVILYDMDKEIKYAEVVNSGKTATIDFIDRIEGRKHLITHEDILETTKLSIDFDQSAKITNFI